MTARKYANYDNTLPTYDKNKLGDMIVGIKAALITGYKDAKPAGWEMLYESIANTADTSKRIVVRSKAVDSERKVFEITDISNTEGSIKCWENWQNGAGVTLLMQARINKSTSWGTTLEIVADNKFVHLIVNASYHGFGDVDFFNTSQPKTLLFDMQTNDELFTNFAIASTKNPYRVQFRDVFNNRFVLRSFCQDQYGFGARVASVGLEIEIYNGGDTNKTVSGNETPFRKVELLKIKGQTYECYGFLPSMLYTDNPYTMNLRQTGLKDTVSKAVINHANGLLSFAVDA